MVRTTRREPLQLLVGGGAWPGKPTEKNRTVKPTSKHRHGTGIQKFLELPSGCRVCNGSVNKSLQHLQHEILCYRLVQTSGFVQVSNT